jgi:hypothetical protein
MIDARILIVGLGDFRYVRIRGKNYPYADGKN